MKKGIYIAMAAALGTAALVVYSSMSPKEKNRLKRDIRTTAGHMEDMKDEMCNVRQDVTKMAKNIADSM